jgi:2-amino-4-hydroxy-6-hydroxymethyldihydropteridine diphosphokinase
VWLNHPMAQTRFAPEHTTYLGLGANLGDPTATLAAARDALARLPRSRLLACSALYRTAPVGGPPGQPDYLNAALALATRLPPAALLAHCLALEGRFGRLRSEPWGPRTLDIDLLLYDDLALDSPDLVLPHPRLHLRRFVLKPLCDLAPQLILPGTDTSLSRLLKALKDPERVELIGTEW